MPSVLSEQAFHDRQARERAEFFRAQPDHLFVAEANYLDHEPWIRPAFAALGEVQGRRVLDFGCGHGMASVLLARRGAKVTAFDLSGGYLQEVRERAGANQVQIDLVQANGEYLPFVDETFDAVWGNAVLHHLDLERAGRELRRVLKPGGRAVFCEPWGGNPLLNWARRQLPYPGKQRTPEETPLTALDMECLCQYFPGLETTGYQLFSMVSRIWKHGRLTRALTWCDTGLLKRVPGLGRWCRYVVLQMKKSAPV